MSRLACRRKVPEMNCESHSAATALPSAPPKLYGSHRTVTTVPELLPGWTVLFSTVAEPISVPLTRTLMLKYGMVAV